MNRLRTVLAVLAALAAVVVAPLALTATWLDDTVDDTNGFVAATAPMARDADARAAIADAVADAVMASLTAELPVEMPGGVEERVREFARATVEVDGFPEFWREANREAHAELLSLLSDDVEGRIVDGWVSVDISPLVLSVLDRLGRGGLPVDELPQPEVRVPIMPAQELAEHRESYRLVVGTARLLPVLCFALVVLALALTPTNRGRLTLAGLTGIGFALSGVAVALLTGPVESVVVGLFDEGQQGLVDLYGRALGDPLVGRSWWFALITAVVGAGCLVGSRLVGRSASD